MKKTITSYITFTRKERTGIMCLGGLIVILLAIRISLPYLVAPVDNETERQKKLAAWEVFLRSQPATPGIADTLNNTAEYLDAADDNEQPLPSVININTADSATLVRLKGIGPVMAGKIIARRTKNGPFTNVKQLHAIQTIPQKIFIKLAPHLAVKDSI